VESLLSVFRLIESRMPNEFYAHFHVRFKRAAVMEEAELRSLVSRHGFSVANLHARLIDVGGLFEYRMVIKSRGRDRAQALWKRRTADMTNRARRSNARPTKR
jgi:putative Mg2+ transporter-C (MgtC) family protein